MEPEQRVLWRGKPSFASFLGMFSLYSTPAWSQLVALALWGFAPVSIKSFLSSLAFVTNWVTGLSEPYSLIYAMGAVIAVTVCVLDWLMHVDAKPLLFVSVSYALPEIARFLRVLDGGYLARCGVLGVASIIGVLGVEVYRRSFEYYVTQDSVVMKGGFLRKWERVVKKGAISDVLVIRPLLGAIFGFAHIMPITQSQLGLGDTFSLGAVVAGEKSAGVIIGGGKQIKEVEARPWNCIYGVRGFREVKEAILK
ncbi:PH domain-containing protein [Infirmifilum lucidum]|uniref:PH domain-containing protein n=1 Tax=Infirmifilum lucidum TaxID=2776706 RepID=A0A7L9FHR3_9CREN|nr:PH domain-containing protein [Infirmifilum lucidum]QOJ78543.1 PH domain-containing protein [Infirmifilum lucidum]